MGSSDKPQHVGDPNKPPDVRNSSAPPDVRNTNAPPDVRNTNAPPRVALSSTQPMRVPGGLFFVTRVEDHHIVKGDILAALSDERESVRGRHILDYVMSEHMDRVMRLIYPDEYILDHPNILYSKPEPWLRHLERGDFEDWHVHGECNLASIYFVDLGEDTMNTINTIKGKKGKDMRPPTTLFSMFGRIFGLGAKEKEGYIVSFPSFYSHCFLPNKSSARKSIIGFKFDIY